MNPADPAAPAAPPDPDLSGRSLWQAPLLVFGLALLVTALLLASISRSIDAKDRAIFDGEVERTTHAVEERLEATITLLRGGAGLFAASREVERDEFARYIRQLRLGDRYPGILGIGFSERIAPADLPRREAQLRAEGLPQFQVWPQGQRDEYHAIVLLEPLDTRNRAALGYDMHSEPTRREAMERARDTGEPAASGKVVLVQEIDEAKQFGFLVYLPLYRGNVVPDRLEDRRQALVGYVYAPLRVGDLLQGVRGSGLRQVDYALFDGQNPVPAALLRSTAAQRPEPALRATRWLQVAGRIWRLDFSSSPAFEALSQRRLLPWLGALSLAASLLLAWITLVQARARRAAEVAAAQRRRNAQDLQASEERARERAERLQELYAELRDSDRRKDEFLAVLAHELRNPLAPIRSSLEILKRVPEGPAAQRAREITERQVSQMVRLIDDLLDVSRISRGKIVLQRRHTPLAQVLEAAVETSRPLLEARHHRLQVEPVDPALVLDLDPARTAQIFTNLLNNAAHYTPEGGQIELRVQSDAQWVRVSVRDNGIGIPPEQLRQVFELFRQLHSKPGQGGLGIGLSLSARLAELHGGHIEARSEGRGQGAEFTVVLPRQAQLQPAAPPEPAEVDSG